MIDSITLCVPYYRQPQMLARQVREWNSYPLGWRVILVDDGSPEPALDVVRNTIAPNLAGRLELYRIDVDRPWNREGARNLSSHLAQTNWICHVDIDHVLPVHAADALLDFEPDPMHWYRFPRWRVGRADETRRKDKVPENAEFVRIHEHIDSYLMRRQFYWDVGGYDEAFVGCLGGGTDFLRRAEALAAPLLLPPSIALHVHTRHTIADASESTLSRDTSEGKRRARAKLAAGRSKPTSHIRFPWSRQL